MNPIFELNAECLRLCAELKACLEEERVALISLQTDAIVQANFKKETLGRQLADKRKQLRETLRARYGVQEISEVEVRLDAYESEAWRRDMEAWRSAWNELRALCEHNQRFIQHSLKNLSLIVDNLKRLFGENSTYSASGKKVEGTAAGKVVEASF